MKMVIRSLFKIRKKAAVATPRRKRKKERYIQPVSKRLLPVPKVTEFQPFDNPWREQPVIEFHSTPQSTWHQTTRSLDEHDPPPLASQNQNFQLPPPSSSIRSPSEATIIYPPHTTSPDKERFFIPTNLSLSPSTRPQHLIHSAQFQYPSRFVNSTPTRVRLHPRKNPQEQAPTSPSDASSITRSRESASPSIASLTDAMKAHSLSKGTFPPSPPSRSPWTLLSKTLFLSPSNEAVDASACDNVPQLTTVSSPTRFFENTTTTTKTKTTTLSSSPSYQHDATKEIITHCQTPPSRTMVHKSVFSPADHHPLTPAMITPTSWASSSSGTSVHRNNANNVHAPFITVQPSSPNISSSLPLESDKDFPTIQQLDNIQQLHPIASSSRHTKELEDEINQCIGSVMEYDDDDDNDDSQKASLRKVHTVQNQGSFGMTVQEKQPSTPNQSSFSSLSQQSSLSSGSSTTSSMPKVTNVSSMATGIVASSNINTSFSWMDDT